MSKRPINQKAYIYQVKEQNASAYLTVWLTLCLTIILSLCMTLIDGVRRNGARMEVECVTEIGLQSILAEYHRELMKQYNLFAIDASYGTAVCGIANTEAHLRNYLERNLSYEDIFLAEYMYGDFLALKLKQVELRKVSILTDNMGIVFRRDAVKAIEADTGLELLQKIQEWIQVIEVNGLEEGDWEQEKKQLDEEIASYDGMEVEIEEDVWETLEIHNPTDKLEAQRREGILKLVLKDEDELSQKILNTEGLLGNRMELGKVNHGNMPQEELNTAQQLIEKFLFQEYLLRYMGRYGMEKEESSMCYQIEYLIAGKDSDIDNLKSAANRICAVREAANALYLVTNEEKMTEIRIAAELVCNLITIPELIPLLEAAIILGWAYAESIYDVKSLMAGGRVPLLKDDDNWHYGLEAALKGELKEAPRVEEVQGDLQREGQEDPWGEAVQGDLQNQELQNEAQKGEGLRYEDYLRIFLMLADTDTITVRAMNMVEADIRSTEGNAAFRLDGCYDSIEAYLQFESHHGYEYEITRQRCYN